MGSRLKNLGRNITGLAKKLINRDNFNKVGSYINKARDIYDGVKKVVDIYDRAKGLSPQNVLPHSKDKYNEMNKQGENFARKRHQQEIRKINSRLRRNPRENQRVNPRVNPPSYEDGEAEDIVNRMQQLRV